MTKEEVLAKVIADGPIASQHIDEEIPTTHHEQDLQSELLSAHLQELESEGSVKYVIAKPGELCKWEAV